MRTRKHGGRSLSFAISWASLLLSMCLGLVSASCARRGDDASDLPSDSDDGVQAPLRQANGFEEYVRLVLEEEAIPAPEALDDAEFVRAHDFPVEPGSCGSALCVGVSIAHAPSLIDGVPQTLLTLTTRPGQPFDTARQPDPMHLAIVLDLSRPFAEGHVAALRGQLDTLRNRLRPEDRLTLVSFDSKARVIASGVLPTAAEVDLALTQLSVGEGANIYGGLRLAFEDLERHRDETRQSRLVLISDGSPDAGITSAAKIVNLVDVYAKRSMTTSSIVTGEQRNRALMREISQIGGGTTYVAATQRELTQPLARELETVRVDIAKDVQIAMESAGDYVFLEQYGNRRATTTTHSLDARAPWSRWSWSRDTAEQAASPPTSDLSHTMVLLERSPELPAQTDTELASVTYEFRTSTTAEIEEGSVEVAFPVPVAQLPSAGFFSDAAASKAFVVASAYRALRAASEHASRAEFIEASDLLDEFITRFQPWQRQLGGADLELDLQLALALKENLEPFVATAED